MKGLLLRLSTLDTGAESAVRVIGFFDTLVKGRATPDTLLRRAAVLAECPVGMQVPRQGVSVRAEPNGELEVCPGPPGDAAVFRRGSDLYWLERKGEPVPLDEITLERFAFAGEILLDRAGGLPKLGDPALVELVLSDSAGEVERSRALHLLGFAPTAPVRVLAVDGDAEAFAAALGGRVAPVGRLNALLVPEPGPPLESFAGARIGVGPVVPAIEATRSWQSARNALRFTKAAALTHADELGGLLLLAERLTAEDLAGVPDVTALDKLATGPGDPDTLEVLRTFCTTGSARKTASAIHRHHSTVATRLARAERVLGFPLNTPDGHFRLNLALALRHLRDTADQPGSAR
ncbi:MAG TPA: helix-turn-helix domain-containing protein [Amycolatopsis sp.]|uniref:helix-turn-helix domain-containing protein n=1 Tax=Amycolatopsis sp. TaxID=37632 RepID=UPI002B4A1823|nr:helix-turn-helix domain-containing protein [Amycolatopsis sp.]HKS44571.1 helix-turn-helix domain-containing protein [Amycolatopsis sp.]